MARNRPEQVSRYVKAMMDVDRAAESGDARRRREAEAVLDAVHRNGTYDEGREARDRLYRPRDLY